MSRLVIALLTAACFGCERGEGTLQFRVLDGAGVPVPARIELLDDRGSAYVADGALEINTECFVVPFPEWATALQRSRSLDNPYTGTRQFYVDGQGRASLAPGHYRLAASRGIEYRVASAAVEITADEVTRVDLAPQRWI